MWIFLLVLLVLAIVATVLTEVERFGWATFLLIVGVAFAQFFHIADLFGWVKTHGVQTIVYALAYVGIGVAWSFVKWFFFLMGFRERYRAYKAQFLQGLVPPLNPDGQVPEQYQKDFTLFLGRLYDDFHGNSFIQRPRAARNKARIVSWMSLWMFSMVGTVLNDPIRRLFNFLFNWFKSLYQKMADSLFAKDVELK